MASSSSASFLIGWRGHWGCWGLRGWWGSWCQGIQLVCKVHGVLIFWGQIGCWGHWGHWGFQNHSDSQNQYSNDSFWCFEKKKWIDTWNFREIFPSLRIEDVEDRDFTFNQIKGSQVKNSLLRIPKPLSNQIFFVQFLQQPLLFQIMCIWKVLSC